MSKYLFLFTIGPVQSFIAQARKTHDLYAGSQMLSSLIDEALNWLINEKKVLKEEDLIFPASMMVKSKPNRLLCLIESGDIQKSGNGLKEHIENYFIDTISKKVLAEAIKIDNEKSVENQLRDFLKIYWVAQPADDLKKNYNESISKIERLMGAVKNIRYFNQFEEKGRKCSLNGEYNVKFYRKNKNDLDKKPSPPKTWKERKFLFDKNIKYYETSSNGNEITLKHIQEGEGLCALSFAKRLYKRREEIESFPSVAYIALQDTLNQLCKSNLTSYCEFVNLLGKEEKEYQLFYEENHTEKKLKAANLKEGKEQISFKTEYKVLKNDLKNKLVLSKYYAILAFDADGMGQKLASCQSQEEHQCLSRLLGKFASEASSYLNSGSRGRTVYAGGDDFLGFVNLNHLFDVLQNLRKLFDEKVNKKLKGVDKEGKVFDYTHLKLTFSAGVAIAHYKHPLSEVLSYARQMEKKAKKIDGISANPSKDAFAIAVLKHSGEIHETVWKWKFKNFWITDLFAQTTKLLKSGDLSDQFIRVLGVQFNSLIDEKALLKKSLQELLEMELTRTILRASDKSQKEEMRQLAKGWFSIFEEGKGIIENDFNNWIHALQICEFITKELNPINPSENKTA